MKAAPEKSAIQFATQHPGLGWMAMWLSRAQVEDLQTSFEFELVKIPEGAEATCGIVAAVGRTLGGKLGYDRPMNRRHFIGLLGGAAGLAARRARATGRCRWSVTSGARSPDRDEYQLRALREGLSEAGYIDGQNVTIRVSLGGEP